MSLINSTADLQKHIIVHGTLNWNVVLPYVVRAERKHIIPLIGVDTLAQLEDAAEEPQTAIAEIFAEASAHFALLMAMPVLSVQVTNAGLLASANSEAKQAEWWQVRDMQRSFQTTAYEALDEGLKALEDNADLFADWKESDHYTVYKELLVYRTDVFNKWFDIHNSRRTFMALKPHMREVEEQYLLPLLGSGTLSQLKSGADDDIVNRVIELMQKATVALTIAKVAEVTTFKLTATGLFYRWDLLPGEKAERVDDEILEKLKNTKQTAAEEYMDMAKDLILEHQELFPDYEVKVVETYNRRLIKSRSGLSM